jgi:hypothetical protein
MFVWNFYCSKFPSIAIHRRSLHNCAQVCKRSARYSSPLVAKIWVSWRTVRKLSLWGSSQAHLTVTGESRDWHGQANRLIFSSCPLRTLQERKCMYTAALWCVLTSRHSNGDLMSPETQITSVLKCQILLLDIIQIWSDSTDLHNRLQYQIYANYLKEYCSNWYRLTTTIC